MITSGHLGLTFKVVAYWRFDCTKIEILFSIRHHLHCSQYLLINYTNIQCTFVRSNMKIDLQVLFPCAHVTAYNFHCFVEFFLKLSMRIFLLNGSTMISDENIIRVSGMVRKYIFCPISGQNFNTSGTGLVIVSSQGFPTLELNFHLKILHPSD